MTNLKIVIEEAGVDGVDNIEVKFFNEEHGEVNISIQQGNIKLVVPLEELQQALKCFNK